MRRIGIIAAWVLATLASTIVAANAVGSLRGQVTDVPAIAAANQVVVEDPAGESNTDRKGNLGDPSSSIADMPTTTESVPATQETDDEGTGDQAAPSSTTSTATSGGPSTPTSAAPAPSTTTTTTTLAGTPEPTVRSYQTEGGDVTVSASRPNVDLVSAIPAPGFAAEVVEAGPGEVRVEFESKELHVTFRARWSDGELRIEIEDEEEDY